MPLSSPVEREPIHHRRIDGFAYRRADGLWDIEGHLTDTKTYTFHNTARGDVAPGVPVHEMWIRLTIDESFVIHAAEAVTDFSPYPATCPGITPRFEDLVGKSIGPGWSRTVRETFGGLSGCTHLNEILGRLGTVAYQAVFPLRRKSGAEAPRKTAPRVLDTCHALDRSGPVVRQHYPQWYVEPGSEG